MNLKKYKPPGKQSPHALLSPKMGAVTSDVEIFANLAKDAITPEAISDACRLQYTLLELHAFGDISFDQPGLFKWKDGRTLEEVQREKARLPELLRKHCDAIIRHSAGKVTVGAYVSAVRAVMQRMLKTRETAHSSISFAIIPTNAGMVRTIMHSKYDMTGTHYHTFQIDGGYRLADNVKHASQLKTLLDKGGPFCTLPFKLRSGLRSLLDDIRKTLCKIAGIQDINKTADALVFEEAKEEEEQCKERRRDPSNDTLSEPNSNLIKGKEVPHALLGNQILDEEGID